MKKPIDPNLGDSIDNELLIGEEGEMKKGEFGFNDYSKPKPEPKFVVKDKETGEEIDLDKKAAPASMTESVKPDETEHHHHHHHHHSSDGSSHHSSDGSHQSSESSHYHSSDSSHHHSSSSSHSRSKSSSHHHSSGKSHSHSSKSKSHSHHHSSKKKKDKKKLPLPARIAIGFLVVIFVFTAAGLGSFLVFLLTGGSDMKTKSDETSYQETIEYKGHTYKFNKDVFAIAFMGIDQREMETSDMTDFVGASDADIVVAIDSKTGVTKAIAIPRDTMVDVDIYTNSGVFLRTQKAQLCLAYAYGDGAEKSCRNTVDAMSRVLLGIPIQKYFALNLNGIKPLNDSIGGVTVESLYDFPDDGIKKGDTITLHGDMAEKYVRERSMDDIEASLNRTQRQIQYAKAYAAQVVPAAIKDFNIITGLYNTAKGYSQTNISLSNATYMGTLLLSKGINDFPARTIQGTMKAAKDPVMENVVHAEFYPDNDDVTEAVLDAFYTQID